MLVLTSKVPMQPTPVHQAHSDLCAEEGASGHCHPLSSGEQRAYIPQINPGQKQKEVFSDMEVKTHLKKSHERQAVSFKPHRTVFSNMSSRSLSTVTSRISLAPCDSHVHTPDTTLYFAWTYHGFFPEGSLIGRRGTN